MKTAFLVLFLSLCIGCSGDSSSKPQHIGGRKSTTVPVSVATVVRKTVPVNLKTIGTVQPVASVSVLPQVDGELIGVHFLEGGEVHAGDILFTIDSRTYEAQWKQVKADLARNRAQLEHARKSAARYGSIVGKGAVAEEQYDQIVASVATLEAAVLADEAAVEIARIRLSHCTIRAPISGIAGGLKIHRGNLVKANDKERPLVTIHQIHPVHIVFSVPEIHLNDIQRRMTVRRLPVIGSIPGVDGLEQGELAFIENAVDTTSGSIGLKAVFRNSQNRLWPGQFVNVTMTLDLESDATVIPVQAVQEGQRGSFVFVVQQDHTVVDRSVYVRRILDGEAVIGEGLSPGEKVVTDGHLRLTRGTSVTVQEQGAVSYPGKGVQG